MSTLCAYVHCTYVHTYVRTYQQCTLNMISKNNTTLQTYIHTLHYLPPAPKHTLVHHTHRETHPLRHTCMYRLSGIRGATSCKALRCSCTQCSETHRAHLRDKTYAKYESSSSPHFGITDLKWNAWNDSCLKPRSKGRVQGAATVRGNG